MRSLIALCLFVAAPAFAADPTGPEILANVDKALNAFKDAVFESKLLVKEKDGRAREYSFTTSQKGDKRLVRFNSPGDVKGMGFLVESKDTMYVFLPGFQKVRRMGTHVRNQTFMGSDFGFDDVSQTTFSPSWDPKLVGSDDKHWIIEITAKKGIESDYPKQKWWVDKTMWQPVKLELNDEKGQKLKTQLREDYKKDSPTHWQPFKITCIDHRRGDHASEIVFSATKIDSGLADDLFSVRQLIRGAN